MLGFQLIGKKEQDGSNNNIANAFPTSKSTLSRTVSIPIFVNMDDTVDEKVFDSLDGVF